MGSPLRASIRLLLYLGLTFALIPVQAVALVFGSRLRQRLPLFYHRVCTRIFGMRVEVHGTMDPGRPILFAANHSSYLDIMVLASLIPGSFVAKREVASWPLFGLLARLQRTVFVVRDRRHAAAQRDELGRRLAAGDALILFPEGTSNDGNRVLPFKSSLFAAALPAPGGPRLTVQPVSIAYVGLDGMPLGRFLRPYYAWYGDMDMGPHLWNVAALGNPKVVVEFHPPAPPESFASRKAMAEYCFRAVAAGVAHAIGGRTAGGPAHESAVEPEGDQAQGEAQALEPAQ